MYASFWGAHQRFFRCLCLWVKVERVVALTKAAIADGKCVVIGLQSTGEARTLGLLDMHNGDLNDFLSNAQ